LAKSALITGITGQDGSYLAEFLLEKGYDVWGLNRRTSTPNTSRISHILKDIHLLPGDVTDGNSVRDAIRYSSPSEVYNLAAQSFVGDSWVLSGQTLNVNVGGCLNVLNAIKDLDRHIRLYQASSSEMFGTVTTPSLNEESPFNPKSPYGTSKLAAHKLVVNYRESYDIFAVGGILFNHESPRRGMEFVTRKITHGVTQIKSGKQKSLFLGNLNAERDWGFAGDYVEAMWLMLQNKVPTDYVVATGTSHSISQFLDLAFRNIGFYEWSNYVISDVQEHSRPNDVNRLCGDPRKIETELGWKAKTTFEELVRMMVQHDLRA
jgi:GDPmannose 4,6-dehydratase